MEIMRFLCCVLVWCWCSLAWAQASNSPEDDVARSLFAAGKTAYEAGNYEDALRFFEDSHARSHRPQLLYNIGQAADRMRDDQKALAAFKAYLAALPDADNRSEVDNRIRALERTRNPSAAPTPRETAQATIAPTSDMPSEVMRRDEGDSITGKWWFWTAITGSVAVVVITAIALSSGDTIQGPVDANTGVTVMTLDGVP